VIKRVVETGVISESSGSKLTLLSVYTYSLQSLHLFMPKVVLFKTPSTATGNDTYQNSFAQAGYDVQYIPVLQEAFHLDELCHIMRNNDTTWGGVVITSKRGAEGWLQAAFKSQGAAIAPSE
jgi:hypothetical protein